jgi:2-hydroxy-3-keto-5-methylthiopentenyl-1-phosphate phosphatase
MKNRKYSALISSDWSECLSPSGPFDIVSFTYPDLEPDVKKIFKSYTGNLIPLSIAYRQIEALLPQPINEEQMDSYLDECFSTYQGIADLIEWCNKRDILFMINTTGMQGYFQRVFNKGLLPMVPVISANPAIKFKEDKNIFCKWHDLTEIHDKPLNTAKLMQSLGLSPGRVIIIGDSGGDGPHFEWGAKTGAMLIGSMTKWSLMKYCSEREIKISLHFGPCYGEGETRNKELEKNIDFNNLIPEIEAVLF